MDGRNLVALRHPSVQPVLEYSELVALLELLDGLLNWAETADVVQQLFDVGFVAFNIYERAQDQRSSLVVHSEDVDLDVLVEVVLVEVPS